MDAVFDPEAEIRFIRLAVLRSRTLKRENSVSLVRSSACKKKEGWTEIGKADVPLLQLSKIRIFGRDVFLISCKWSVTKTRKRILEG